MTIVLPELETIISSVVLGAAAALGAGYIHKMYQGKKSRDAPEGVTKAECTACDLRSLYGTITEQIRVMFAQSRDEIRDDIRELKTDLKGEIKEVREDLRAHTNREREVV